MFRLYSLLLLLPLCLPAQAPKIVGDWSGTLQTPAMQLRVVLHVVMQGDRMAATLDSVTQGVNGIPVDEITLDGSVVRFTSKRIDASYEGTLSTDARSIDGKFTQAGMTFPLNFSLGVQPERPRPQMPKPPYPYQVTEVTFENKNAGISLAGTLTSPNGKGPFPAAILLTGSGPQDRDSSIMGHKPFLVLADHLTRQGITVLRYDDRGFGKSGGKFLPATSEDFASDASAALDFLKSRPEVDSRRIGYIGHSEGGILAPMASAGRSDVAFLVLLAAPAVTGEQVMLAQGPAVMKAMGVPQQGIEANSALQRKIFELIRTENDPGALQKKMSELLPPGPQGEAQVRQMSSPWMVFFTKYDPAPTLKKLKCPVLAVYGELDLQVLPSQNLPVMESALKEGGVSASRAVQLPTLNHLLQTARTGAVAEYAQIEETISPAALKVIDEWLGQRLASAAKQ